MKTKLIFSLFLGMFFIGIVNAGNYVFENTSGTELMKIYGENGNVSILGDLNVRGDIYGAIYGVWNGSSDYYLKSNPFAFFNSTTLSSLSQLANDLGIGNWTLDKPNYYNSSQVDSAISSANTSMKNYADGKFIQSVNEGNLNVNSSTYWAGLNSVSGILGSQITNDLNWVNASTVGGSYYLITNPYGFYNSTTLQNLSQLVDNLGNRGYTSLSNFTNNLNFINSTYNSTYDLTSRDVTANRSVWESTYNSTYDSWAYNQTTAAMLIANNTFIKKTGDNGTGEYNFNNGWTNGGLSIRNGDLYAQTVYVYNISSLQVSNLNINGSLLPSAGFDNQFDIGSGSLRWNDGYYGGNLYVNGTIYNSNGLPVNGNVTGVGSVNRVTFWNGGSSITSEDNLTWDSTNKRLGIGTTSPSTALQIGATTKLSNTGIINWGASANQGILTWDTGKAIIGSMASQDLSFSTNSNIGTSEKMRITTTGNVGIGTTSPSSKLDITASDYNVLELTRTSAASYGLYVTDLGDGAAQLDFDSLTNNTGFIFRTKDSGGTSKNAMFINPDGNVGIGTTSPDALLEVGDADSPWSDVNGIIRLSTKTSGGGAKRWEIGSSGSIDAYDFKIYDVNRDVTPFLIEWDTGNVGIGTTNPTGHLSVLNNEVSTTTSFYGIYDYHTKTAGTTNSADDFYGLYNYMAMNHVGSTIGYLVGGRNYVNLANGTSGGAGEDIIGSWDTALVSGGTANGSVYGSYSMVDLNAGDIIESVYGSYINVDLESASTGIGGDVYGLHIYADVDENPTGNAYMLYIDSGTGVNYGIYQVDAIDNYLAGNLGIGDTTPSYNLDVAGTGRFTGALISATLDTGQGANELYDMDQNVLTTSAPTFATINTGSGAMDLGDAAVANGDTNSIPTGDQVYDFVTGLGYTNDMTAAEILTAIKTVDGSGSGLDADLLDGVDSTRILVQRTDIPGSADLNTYTTTGLYHQNSNADAASGSNYPASLAGMLEVVEDGSMVYQKYTVYNSAHNVYVRTYYSGSWYSWNLLWNNNNDGSGSTLDADLLDTYNSDMASTASTVAVRDGSGDINARLFKSEYDTTNPTIGYIMTQVDTASNNYLRPSTPAQLKTALGLDAGGSGDIWVEKAGDTMTGRLEINPNPDLSTNTGVAANTELLIDGSTPQIKLNDPDTGGVDWWIHNNDALYFLRSSGTDGDTTWQSPYPLILNTDASATFGADITVNGGDITLGADVGLSRSGANIWTSSDRLDLTAIESAQIKGIRGLTTNSQLELYERVSIGDPGGWSSFQQAPSNGLATWGGAYIGNDEDSDYLSIDSDGTISDVGGDVLVSDTMVVSVNSRSTAYTASNLQLYTSDNTPPGISFHRAGYSAVNLYENNGYLYMDRWVGTDPGLIWAAGIDGSGSGLDADLLDTHDSAYFATAASLGSYLPLAGGTMTGSLTFNQGASTRNVGIIGTYDPKKLAAIWSMGAAYQLGSDGTAGSLYGLSYSYEPDYGGAGNNPGAIAGLGHQMQWRASGATQTAIGTGIWTSGGITSTTLNTGSGAMDLGDAAVANGDTNSIPTGDQVYDFVTGSYGGDITAIVTGIGTCASGSCDLRSYDGSGSGLDADLLDTISSESFLRSDISDTVNAGVTYSWSATNTEGLRFTNSDYGKSLYIGGWSSANTAGVSRIRNSNDNLHIDSGSDGGIYLNWYSAGAINLGSALSGTTAGFSGTVTAPTFSGALSGNAATASNAAACSVDSSCGMVTGAASTSMTAPDFYASSWFRNDGADEGLYNSATNRHFYSGDGSYWVMDSANGLQLRSGHEGTITGYLYWDGTAGSNNFGLLSPDGSWGLRLTNSNAEIYHALTVDGAATFSPDADSQLVIDNAGTNAVKIYAAASDEIYMGANNAYQLRFLAAGTSIEVKDGVNFLVGTGNVGIGDSTPDYDLDVAGTLGVDSTIYAGACIQFPSGGRICGT